MELLQENIWQLIASKYRLLFCEPPKLASVKQVLHIGKSGKNPMIQVLDPQEWIIQVKSFGYKGRKLVSICGNLGQIVKSKTARVFLQQRENLWIMQNKVSFCSIRRVRF